MSESIKRPPQWHIAWRQESERVPGHKPVVMRHISIVEAPTLQLALDAWSRQCYINAAIEAAWNDGECECVRRGER